MKRKIVAILLCLMLFANSTVVEGKVTNANFKKYYNSIKPYHGIGSCSITALDISSDTGAKVGLSFVSDPKLGKLKSARLSGVECKIKDMSKNDQKLIKKQLSEYKTKKGALYKLLKQFPKKWHKKFLALYKKYSKYNSYICTYNSTSGQANTTANEEWWLTMKFSSGAVRKLSLTKLMGGKPVVKVG